MPVYTSRNSVRMRHNNRKRGVYKLTRQRYRFPIVLLAILFAVFVHLGALRAAPTLYRLWAKYFGEPEVPELVEDEDTARIVVRRTPSEDYREAEEEPPPPAESEPEAPEEPEDEPQYVDEEEDYPPREEEEPPTPEEPEPEEPEDEPEPAPAPEPEPRRTSAPRRTQEPTPTPAPAPQPEPAPQADPPKQLDLFSGPPMRQVEPPDHYAPTPAQPRNMRSELPPAAGNYTPGGVARQRVAVPEDDEFDKPPAMRFNDLRDIFPDN